MESKDATAQLLDLGPLTEIPTFFKPQFFSASLTGAAQITPSSVTLTCLPILSFESLVCAILSS